MDQHLQRFQFFIVFSFEYGRLSTENLSDYFGIFYIVNLTSNQQLLLENRKYKIPREIKLQWKKCAFIWSDTFSSQGLVIIILLVITLFLFFLVICWLYTEFKTTFFFH